MTIPSAIVNRPPRVAIVGGGISGLAAAHRVAELLPNAEISVIEAAQRVGGVLETVEREGYLLERSADNFLTSRPGGVALCHRLGLEEQLLPTDETRRRALVLSRGRLLPIPAGFHLMSPRRLGPFLRSPVLSLRGRLRVLAEPLVSPRGRFNVSNDDALVDPLGAEYDESVSSFARRRLGDEAFERLVQPLVAGIYTADSDRLSMAATMPEFLKYEQEYGSLLRATVKRRPPKSEQSAIRNPRSEIDSTSGARYGLFVAPRGGIGAIVTALAARMAAGAVRLGTCVQGIHRAPDEAWEIELSSTVGGQSARERFDAVIVALPAHAAAEVLVNVDRRLATELAAIDYAGCIVVSCTFQRDQIAHSLDGFGFVVPQVERRRIIASSFASNKFPGRAPDGRVLLRTFVGGSLQPELMELPDAELRRLVLDELADLLQIKGLPAWIDIARWPRSMPQYHVGHLARVARIDKLAVRWPTLALAGNAYHGVGIPQCITSGEAAAESVLAKWKRAGH